MHASQHTASSSRRFLSSATHWLKRGHGIHDCFALAKHTCLGVSVTNCVRSSSSQNILNVLRVMPRCIMTCLQPPEHPCVYDPNSTRTKHHDPKLSQTRTSALDTVRIVGAHCAADVWVQCIRLSSTALSTHAALCMHVARHGTHSSDQHTAMSILYRDDTLISCLRPIHNHNRLHRRCVCVCVAFKDAECAGHSFVLLGLTLAAHV